VPEIMNLKNLVRGAQSSFRCRMVSALGGESSPPVGGREFCFQLTQISHFGGIFCWENYKYLSGLAQPF
jgi:hypothetical protein